MEQKLEFLYLSQEDVIRCGALDMDMVLERIERFFSLHDLGECIVPDKVTLRWGDAASEAVTGRINGMPGFVGGEIRTAGIKWIGSKPLNPQRHALPRASALTILNDPETGAPLAVMDGTVISAMRTGAVTGVAAKYLARRDSVTAAFIGAGTQNHTQILAVRTAIPSLSEIRLFDISRERIDAFIDIERERFPGIPLVGVSTAEEAVRGADIVVTATTSLTPIVRAEWIRKGAFLANIGNYEFEFEAVRLADKIVADNWDAILHRGIQTPAIMANMGKLERGELHAELGSIVKGKFSGRETSDETIFFCAVGMGAEDIVVARKIFDEAVSKDIGTWLTLWERPFWV